MDVIGKSVENYISEIVSNFNEFIFLPFTKMLPNSFFIDLNVTTIDEVQQIYKALSSIGVLMLVILALYFLSEQGFLELFGVIDYDFYSYTAYLFAKGYFLIMFSIHIIGWYLVFSNMIIDYFASMFSTKFFDTWAFLTPSFSNEITYVIFMGVLLLLYLALIAVVVIRLLDLMIVISIFPLVIPFYIFYNKNFINSFINVIIGVPIAHLSMLASLALAVGLVGNLEAVKELGAIGSFILAIAAMVHAIVKPSVLADMFKLNSVDAIDMLQVQTKALILGKQVLK